MNLAMDDSKKLGFIDALRGDSKTLNFVINEFSKIFSSMIASYIFIPLV